MLNIAIIGHVDHGKSTLIGRLLYDTNSLPKEKLEEIKRTCEELGVEMEFAYVIDALEEERKNRMTIETSQVFFRSKKRDYAIIDAPGHKEFIKNMVTGVSQADAAILIVDVKEGVKEQTKRHAYLAKLLGIGEVIVAINKMDLVNYDRNAFERVREEVLDYLRKIGLKAKFVIPISAYYGDNVAKKSEKMDWYKGLTLLEALDRLEKRSKGFDFRFIVQDEFRLDGETIYLGNVIAGKVKRGEIVKRFPEGDEVLIKKIFYGEKGVEKAKEPLAVGIIADKKLRRGNVLAKGEAKVRKKIEALVFCLLNEIKEGNEYLLKCMTQESLCKIEKVFEKIDVENLERKEGKRIREIEIGRVLISLDKPLAFENFKDLPEMGRFVLIEKGKIIAGGILTNLK